MDATPVLIGVISWLALGWGVMEARTYFAWVRRGRAGPRPSRWRLRLGIYAALVVVGAILGAVIGTLQLQRGL
jgi:hypothetical protein